MGGDKPPAPSADALPFTLEIDTGGVKDLKTPLQDASTLYRLRNEAPPGSDILVRIAQNDLPVSIDAMWGAGYYDATVVVEVAGQPLALGANGVASAIRAADGYKGRRWSHRDPRDSRAVVRAEDHSGRGGPLAPLHPAYELPQRVIGLKPGDPAASASITAAQARIVDYYRAQSHPFAKVADPEPVVDFPSQAMDVTFDVTQGPTAGIGDISVSGLQTVDPAVVRTFIYTKPGEPYSPDEIAAIRRSLQRLEILSSVRVSEGEALDANGNLPLFVELTERKRHAVGGSILYSTLDGPEARAYWVDRNLFGGAETLRLEANVFYTTIDNPSQNNKTLLHGRSWRALRLQLHEAGPVGDAERPDGQRLRRARALGRLHGAPCLWEISASATASTTPFSPRPA